MKAVPIEGVCFSLSLKTFLGLKENQTQKVETLLKKTFLSNLHFGGVSYKIINPSGKVKRFPYKGFL